MKIRKVAIRNFRSMTDVEFEVPGPGLYLISGRNEQEDAIGSNGAGKSTLVEALHWAFTGTTSRGVSGPSLEPWSGPTGRTAVALDTDVGDIVRRRNPNVLDGLEPNPLLARVALHPQFRQSFMDLSPSERMSLFESAFRGAYWSETRGRAQERATKHARLSETQKTICGTLDAELAKLVRRVAELESEKAGLAQGDDARDEMERIARQSEVVEKIVEKKLAAGEELDRLADEVNGEVEKCRETAREHWAEIESLDPQITRLRREAERLKVGDKCPLCGQTIAKYVAGKLQSQCQGLEGEAQRLEAELDRHAEGRDAAHRKETELEGKERRLRADSAQNELELNDSLVDRRRLDYRLGELRDARRERDTEMAVIDGKIEELKESMDKARKSCADAKARQAESEEEKVACEYWVRGFNELRLRLAKDAAHSLAELANVNLASLGLSGWRFLFRMERETKSKTLAQKFHAFVTGPDAEVPIASCSGGEGQRLRLAVEMAFADLVGAYHGLRTNIEIWDEPDCHLSGEGLDCLIRALRGRTDTRAVFLITHNKLAESLFDRTYLAVKNKAGITTLEADDTDYLEGK